MRVWEGFAASDLPAWRVRSRKNAPILFSPSEARYAWRTEHWSFVFRIIHQLPLRNYPGECSLGRKRGREGKGQAVSPSPYCSKPVLICITLWGLSLFCHLVDCHQISSDMMHGRFMHREADTAGVWCVCVSFPVNNTQGAVTLTRFIMIDLFGRIETFTSIEQKPHQTGNLYLNRCLSQRVEPCFCLAG